jgi:hypothetical protein
MYKLISCNKRLDGGVYTYLADAILDALTATRPTDIIYTDVRGEIRHVASNYCDAPIRLKLAIRDCVKQCTLYDDNGDITWDSETECFITETIYN